MSTRGGTPQEPAFGYALDEPTRPAARASLMPGPTLLLKRGQPVAITVVNELPEATAVHWHGIELESYFDGVAGFSGKDKRIAPVIAPNDSFVARFTPPRSGTFIYHPARRRSAAADRRPLRRAPGGRRSGAIRRAHDLVVLITTPRRRDDAGVVFINGSKSPAPVELRAGDRYRVRLINIHTFRPSMIARIVAGADTLTWRALAKDGMDLPKERAIVKPAVQQMGNGETFDFELVPPAVGDVRLTVSAANGALLVTLPLRVR